MTPDEHEAGRQTAQQIQRDHPRWMVVYGAYTREYVAFPLFPAPAGTILASHYPPALIEHIRATDHYATSHPAPPGPAPAHGPGAAACATRQVP